VFESPVYFQIPSEALLL